MKACMAYLRTALLALVALSAAFQAAEAQFPFGPGGGPGGGGGGPNCVALGQTLQRSCAAVQGQLTQNSQQILGATCAQVATVVQKQSSTPQCCADTRTFVTAGCTCDANLLSLAPLGGVSPDAIRAVGKVAQVSSCASDAFGGEIKNTCPGVDDCSAYRPH